jgi:hypothetical protein
LHCPSSDQTRANPRRHRTRNKKQHEHVPVREQARVLVDVLCSYRFVVRPRNHKHFRHSISDYTFIRMQDVFHINLDEFDVASIRVGAQRNTPGSTTRQIQREMDHYMQQKSLMSFVKLCRIFNLDPMNTFSLHIVLILMCKHQDRMDLVNSFTDSLHEDIKKKIELDLEAVQAFEHADNTFLTSTGDWIALFHYIRLYALSESDTSELENDVRLQLFMQSMRFAQVLSQHMDLEYIVKAFLSIYLINIPAAKILERVILQHDHGVRDIELRSLRTVHHFTDNSLHMSAQTQKDTILLILKNIHMKPEFFKCIAEIMDTVARDHVGKQRTRSKKFSLRRHISEKSLTAPVQYVHTFENWSSQQKFSVTTSINTQRLFYFAKAQDVVIPEHVYANIFDASLVDKVVHNSLHQIDVAAVLLVIKSLRVYHNNIQSLLDFRTQCTLGINAATRATLTQAVLLQLYVATWQHESIREQCWQSIIGVYNYTISAACELFRKRHTYEYEAVLESLLKCLLE